MASQRVFVFSDLVGLIICGVVGMSVASFYWDEFFPRRTCCGRSTQVRGIQQGFVLYSNSNNGYYPGYTSDGLDDFGPITASATDFGSNALTDDDIGKVYALMLTGEFFTVEYIISPHDHLALAGTGTPNAAIKPTIDFNHYSYALLDMNDSPSNRRDEWKDTNNSQAPIVADPTSDIRPLFTTTYHSDVLGVANTDVYYEGNIAWNDNHVTFENAALFPTGALRMGNTANMKPLNPFKNASDDGAKFIW